MREHQNYHVFLALVRAGLWEQSVQLSHYDNVNYEEVYKLSEEQSVVGLVAAGLEHVEDITIPKENVLSFVGAAVLLEQRNIAMNSFVAELIEKLRNANIYALIVKGQGIAQCYERPLWRAAGDIDLFLTNDNYTRSKKFLLPMAIIIEEENSSNLHLAMAVKDWVVELHGTLRGGLFKRVDKVIDEVQKTVFGGGQVRSWMNGCTQVFLPRVDEDIVLVFTHIIQHFFKGGIGLRQVCDWCRLLWKYRDIINRTLLEQRIREMRLMSEWKTLASLAVNELGMPATAMPFYTSSKHWNRKAQIVLSFIMEAGNFGHNRDVSYYNKYPYIIRKTISIWYHTWDSLRHFFVFPLDSVIAWCSLVKTGLKFVMKGK